MSVSSFRQVTTCPGCGNRNGQAISNPGTSFTVTVGGSNYTQPEYSILDCANCGLLYKDVVLSDQSLNDYYAGVDFKKWEIHGLFPTERIVIEYLNQLSPGARILDVGCSSGRLLSALPSHYDLYGMEPNSTAAAIAASKGITIIAQNDTDSGPFDAVVLMDVFEHLTEPTQVLGSLIKRLKPGGKLILATGDGDFPLCRESPAEFWYFRNVEHVCMISRKFANWLGTQIPVKPTSWTKTSHYDSSFRKRLPKWLRVAAWRQHRNQSWLWKGLFRFLPMLGRAKHWSNCPAYDLGTDHTVAVFETSCPTA